MDDALERDGVSAVWLCCFLREAPSGTVVRGYEGEFAGMVVEMPAENPEFDGQMVELAYIHNDKGEQTPACGRSARTPGCAAGGDE